MTLIEMLAAITILMIMTGILAEVFYQSTAASSKGKGMAEVFQVDRALKSLISRDLSGCTADAFSAGENGFYVDPVHNLPPGPYESNVAALAAFGWPAVGPAAGSPGAATMRRMLMGGSDFLAFTSANASQADKSVSKVFYILRETGELVRIVSADTGFNNMDYRQDAISKGVDTASPIALANYEDARVVAENIQRVKFSFLDRGKGPISDDAQTYADGAWLDSWDWGRKPYLPAAVKVQMNVVDHLWKTADDDNVSNRGYDPAATTSDDDNRASERFDPDDGEPFSFIVDLPLGMTANGA